MASAASLNSYPNRECAAISNTSASTPKLTLVVSSIGPHKLAMGLLQTYKLWAGRREQIQNARPLGPHRSRSSEVGARPTRAAFYKQFPPVGRTAELEHGTRQGAVAAEAGIAPRIKPFDALMSASAGFATPERKIQTASQAFLLVDDNVINLKILSAYIEKLGRAYQAVANGREAVDAYTQDPGRFAAVLMDLSMPVMDGFEATRQIRTHERRHKLPAVTILALTGLATDSAYQEALESGIDVFLTKPVRLKILGQELESRNIIPAPLTQK